MNHGVQLRRAGAPLNSRNVVCFKSWPCKRMTCDSCRLVRRNHFVNTGTTFAIQYKLTIHCEISFERLFDEHSWSVLQTVMPTLSKSMSGKIGKYIRSLGLGEKTEVPHVHYLLQSGQERTIERHARGLENRKVRIHFNDATDAEGLLGYFFDKNFIPAFLSPERPRRIRILSGSRGIACGFPSKGRKSTKQGGKDVNFAQSIAITAGSL